MTNDADKILPQASGREPLVAPPSEALVSGAVRGVDLAIAAWLHAKGGRSGSARTRQTYADLVGAFRARVMQAGLDLDGPSQTLTLLAQGWAGEGEPAPATFNQRLAVLSSFYRYAARHGLLVGANPIEPIERRPVQPYGNAQGLELREVRRRMAAIDRGTLPGKRDYALLSVALQTGRRLSEVAGLRWGDIRIGDGRRVTLSWPRCKGGKAMADTLPVAVGEALLAYLHAVHGADLGSLAAEQPVWLSFSRNRSHGRALGIQSIADICEKHLGTSKVHTLRHTFARAMEEAGAKVSDIQARLGHESLATTGRYLAALKKAENPQAETLAELLGLE